MPSVAGVFYNSFRKRLAASTQGLTQVNLDGGTTFRVFYAASADKVNNNNFSVFSQVCAAAIGIVGASTKGEDMANVTFTEAASGTATWDADDIIVTASGGDLSAQAVVVYASAVSASAAALIAYYDLGGGQLAGTGTTFKVVWSADGIIQVK